MPRANPVAELAGKLIQALRKEREQGLYPLTVAQLAGRLDPPATPEQALKALARKPFSAEVLVARARDVASPLSLPEDSSRLAESSLLLEYAVGRLSTAEKPLCSLAQVVRQVIKLLQPAFKVALQRRLTNRDLPDSIGHLDIKKTPHLYLKRYPLPKDPAQVLSEKLVRGLEAHRDPVSLTQLLRETDPTAKPALQKKAFAQEPFASRALVVLPGKPDALVAFAEEGERVVANPRLLEMVLTRVRTPDNQAVSLTDLAKKLAASLRPSFENVVRRQMTAGSLPPAVGCLRIKKKPHLFLRADIAVQPMQEPIAPVFVPQPPPLPILDFGTHFAQVFDQLDRQGGGYNFVSLVDLRKALPLERSQFDSELQKLRQGGVFTLSGAEGRQGLSAEEQEAGIPETGTLLLFVSRKTH
jgi:hypothetical protein